MKDLLGGLRPDDRFKMVLFAGASYVLSPTSLDGTEANVEVAVDIYKMMAAKIYDKPVEEITGAGIRGVCAGRQVLIASASHLVRELGELPREISDAADSMALQGLSPVAVAVDGGVVAVAGIGDPLLVLQGVTARDDFTEAAAQKLDRKSVV